MRVGQVRTQTNVIRGRQDKCSTTSVHLHSLKHPFRRVKGLEYKASLVLSLFRLLPLGLALCSGQFGCHRHSGGPHLLPHHSTQSLIARLKDLGVERASFELEPAGRGMDALLVTIHGCALCMWCRVA